MLYVGRRHFIALLAGTAATWPLRTHAQQQEQVRRVGLLLGIAENDPEAHSRVKAFQQGLRDLGWVEGRNIQIDYRFAASDPNRIKNYIAELLNATPDVIVGNSTPVTPIKFELAINLKVAKSMGLKVQDSFVLLADEVIE
jgi:putative ABC transport system substrate-binding protein